MHRRLQFDKRENPASDRRYDSRSAVAIDAPSNTAEKGRPSTAAAGTIVDETPAELHVPAHAATNRAATVEGTEILLRQKQPAHADTAVERPLTCDEAAAFVRVHPKTVKRMARSGELPGHFRFGRWFFYASELDSWMRTELHSSRHSCR